MKLLVLKTHLQPMAFVPLGNSTEDDKDPELASSPVQHKEDKHFRNQYQQRKKPDVVQQQLQSSEI